MSGSLVPSGDRPRFDRARPIDNVALVDKVVNISVTFLERLSKAGLHAYTVYIGRMICKNFALEPVSHQRISDIIRRLRRYASLGEILWFGFGIEDLIPSLAETQEGTVLVALCAALSTSYAHSFSAQVLMELCNVLGVQQSSSPSLSQWEALVQLCAGILTTEKFLKILNGFNDLVSGRSGTNSLRSYQPTTHVALAKVIFILAQLSRRAVANATFVGGLDCGWIAAFTEWVLCLDISIVTSGGEPLYRSRLTGANPAQVKIVVPERATDTTLLSSKASIEPLGASISQNGASKNRIRRCSTWSKILHDTFGPNIKALVNEETGRNLGLYLHCLFLLQKPDPRQIDELVGFKTYFPQRLRSRSLLNKFFFNYHVDPLLWAQENGKIDSFVSFASARLPELAGCIENFHATARQELAEELALGALDAIQTVCPCRRCSPEYNDPNPDPLNVCLKTLAEVIAIFLWIIFVSDVDDDVCPLVDGLTNLYNWQLHFSLIKEEEDRNQERPSMTCNYPALWLDLVFYCFSGLPQSDFPSKEVGAVTLTARAGGGICAYYHALENPNLPPTSISKVRVVRGYISHSGSPYQAVQDIPENAENVHNKADPKSDEYPNHSTQLFIEPLLQADSEIRLAMSFRISYLAPSGKNCSIV